jgi:glycosyltransferase involved in cell wall biosynthesis
MEEYFIYVGRISPEKGIRELITYWIDHNIKYKLKIIGDGPLFDELVNKSASYSQIEWKGKLNREDVLDYIKSAQALIFPSNCYEGFPLTIVEAFSLETPVLSTDIGSQSEIIINGYNGLHYIHGSTDDFLNKIKTLSDKSYAKKLGNNARIDYLDKYTAEKNYEILSSIYNSILE